MKTTLPIRRFLSRILFEKPILYFSKGQQPVEKNSVAEQVKKPNNVWLYLQIIIVAGLSPKRCNYMTSTTLR